MFRCRTLPAIFPPPRTRPRGHLHPIIDLSVFRYRSYAIGTFIMTVVGFVLYGSTVLLPLLMQELFGYTATHAGITNLPRGMASFIFMPLVGFLTGKVDSRKLLGVGFLATAFAMYRISMFSLGVASWNYWLPLTVQGAGLGLIFVPLTTVTNDPIPRERMGNATSIFDLMRNIGASIGIAMVETMQVRKAQMHINILDKHVNTANPLTRQTIDGLPSALYSAGQGCGNRKSRCLCRCLGDGAAAGGDAGLQRYVSFSGANLRVDAAAGISDARAEEGQSGNGALSARRENARSRLILCSDLIFDPVVFRLRDGTPAHQFGRVAVRAAGDYAIRSLAAHSG
jgi:hypothetical protein